MGEMGPNNWGGPTINIRAGDVKGQHHHEGGLGWGWPLRR
jgi:hypothetical protein